ncbi:sn-glycerol-3-phosphate ABC transporter substrate-binding protein UgpB [Methylobacterium sp. WL103]|uniref:sn-glycerol-3-phosphate ABC transporter substrate-binding protein UgpB n=1 Tax=unclassified Methylobacterium TaxID=2615210 RepID=UPI0011CAF381|nr:MULTISPECIES: sn-glycerol-3-phosphate ABC transporter substrate-binding protein UgpB [unclassified Methylobacterium]TXM75985.1 sn-glycerol-3-phosphate ABC transporter substrate-binding protein UgpB [Methylobacterium sp. WL12]TXN06980.1 sn-glycerol-3-phosphate ABC transporter substrate-binding protein UgpB [Methylobacterium sp. WL103]
MDRRVLLAGVGGLAAWTALRPSASVSAADRTPIVLWHAMSGANGEEVERLTRDFNASQSEVTLEAVFKGTYPETLTAAIAAYRAGKAPHVVQIFEVGTGTMLQAGPAIKPAWKLAEETGLALDPKAYIPGVRGYYSLADGKLASMPFNSSTAVMWYNRDAFEKAGLDPDKPPATYDDFAKAARTLASKAATPIASTSAWMTWIQFEEYAAIQNLAYATENDGYDGLGAELLINTKPFVDQLQRFLDLSKDGAFKYAGRDGAPDAVFYSGQAAIGFGSSSGRADIVKNAKFRYAEAFLPTEPALNPRPNNSIIGGASLWAMTAPKRSEAEYKGVAAFYAFLAKPEQVALYAQNTGYVPVTLAGYEATKQAGYFDRNPGTDVPARQLSRGELTPNSRGLRLGRLPEIRAILYEEIEKALQGQQTAQSAMDGAVARGNRVLRDFQKSARG